MLQQTFHFFLLHLSLFIYNYHRKRRSQETKQRSLAEIENIGSVCKSNLTLYATMRVLLFKEIG